MTTLNTAELQALMKGPRALVLLHVSDEREFAKEHIAQSVHLPADHLRFVQRVQALVGDDPDCGVVIYGADGDAATSRRAVDRLVQAGLAHVYHYEGGIRAWREAGIMLESSPASPVEDA